ATGSLSQAMYMRFCVPVLHAGTFNLQQPIISQMPVPGAARRAGQALRRTAADWGLTIAQIGRVPAILAPQPVIGQIEARQAIQRFRPAVVALIALHGPIPETATART